MKRVVVLGGGTGSYTILKSLKKFNYQIDAIVNMSDNGGSTGILRDELGVLPPGDIRQCLVGLSVNDEVRDLFSYRFDRGSLKGQSLGNIILSGLSLKYDNFSIAVEVASRILQIKGQVLPITLEKNNLAVKKNNRLIVGEHQISKLHLDHPAKLLLQPPSQINPLAQKSINQADYIIIAPGHLYCSILPIFLVKKTIESIKKSKAKIILMINLVNNSYHHQNWHVQDYIDTFESYIGSRTINYVIYNTNPPKQSILDQYATEKQYPVDYQLEKFRKKTSYKLIGTDVLSNKITLQNPDDLIPRNIIRHDGEKVIKILQTIIN